MAHEFEEAGLAELAARGVFGLGEAVGEGDEEVAGFQLNGLFGVVEVVEKADDGSAAVEAADLAGCGEE